MHRSRFCLATLSSLDVWPESERLREITRSMFPEFSLAYFTQMLLSYIFGPSVVKYDILTNNRRSKLHPVVECRFPSSCGIVDFLPLSIPLKFILKKIFTLITWFLTRFRCNTFSSGCLRSPSAEPKLPHQAWCRPWFSDRPWRVADRFCQTHRQPQFIPQSRYIYSNKFSFICKTGNKIGVKFFMIHAWKQFKTFCTVYVNI